MRHLLLKLGVVASIIFGASATAVSAQAPIPKEYRNRTTTNFANGPQTMPPSYDMARKMAGLHATTKADYNAVNISRAAGDDEITLTQISYDFFDFYGEVSISGEFLNNTDEEQSFNYAVGLFDETGALISLRGSSHVFSLEPGYQIYPSDYVSASSLSDGTYYAAFEYRLTSSPDSEFKVAKGNDGHYAVEFSKKGDEISFAGVTSLPGDEESVEPIGCPRLSFDALSPSVIERDKENTISVTVTNKGEADFDGVVFFNGRNSNNKWISIMFGEASIAKGNTVTLSKTLTTEDFNNDYEAGNYPLYLYYNYDKCDYYDGNHPRNLAIVESKDDVVAVTGLSMVVDDYNKVVEPGRTFYFQCKVTPENATNTGIVFSSDRPDDVTFMNSFVGTTQGAHLRVKDGAKGGKVTVTATSVSNPEVTATFDFEIESAPVFNISSASVTPSPWLIGREGNEVSFDITNKGNADFNGRLNLLLKVNKDNNVIDHTWLASTDWGMEIKTGEKKTLKFSDILKDTSGDVVAGDYGLSVTFHVDFGDYIREIEYVEIANIEIKDPVAETTLVFNGVKADGNTLKVGEKNRATISITNTGNDDATERMTLKLASNGSEVMSIDLGEITVGAGETLDKELEIDLTSIHPASCGNDAMPKLWIVDETNSTSSVMPASESVASIPLAKGELVLTSFTPGELVVGAVTTIHATLQNIGDATIRESAMDFNLYIGDDGYWTHFNNFEVGAGKSKEITFEIDLTDVDESEIGKTCGGYFDHHIGNYLWAKIPWLSGDINGFVELTLVGKNKPGIVADGLIYAVTGENTVSVIGYTNEYAGTKLSSEVSDGASTFVVTDIAEGAFKGCEALTKLVIPETVETIGDGAFAGCANLMFVIAESDNPAVIAGQAFDDAAYSTVMLAVPEGTAEAYRQANDWSRFVNIVDGTSGIEGIEADGGEAVIYDLSGRRVKNPTSGFYIVNGRKVLIRR